MSQHADEPEPKKSKLQNCLPDFSNVKYTRVLNDNVHGKRICVQGTIPREDDNDEECDNVVITLEKTPFEKEKIVTLLSSNIPLTSVFHNDIYSSYTATLPVDFSGAKVDVIYPATEHHIAKYLYQEMHLIEETPENYQSITLPYIQENSLKFQWVYNILEKRAEQDRVVFDDPDPETGFILLPDLKWDVKGGVDNLYVVGICHQKNIKSLRDLTTQHLPLLENMFNKGKEEISRQFGVSGSQLRVYVHYQPSYYHFHVHYTNIKVDTAGCSVTGAHLLSDVINNITLMSDYYQRRSLTFGVKVTQGLYLKYKEHGRV